MPTIRNDPGPDRHDDTQRLYITHANRLRRVVGSIVNTSDANLEDACSFAWLQLLTTDPRRDTIGSWLVKVAVREAWRLDRQQRRTIPIEDELARAPVRADPVEVRTLLVETIEALPGIHERKREMLLLHATGFTMREIAEAHDISPARARELVYRARLQLLQAIGRGDIDPRSRK